MRIIQLKYKWILSIVDYLKRIYIMCVLLQNNVHIIYIYNLNIIILFIIFII